MHTFKSLNFDPMLVDLADIFQHLINEFFDSGKGNEYYDHLWQVVCFQKEAKVVESVYPEPEFC